MKLKSITNVENLVNECHYRQTEILLKISHRGTSRRKQFSYHKCMECLSYIESLPKTWTKHTTWSSRVGTRRRKLMIEKWLIYLWEVKGTKATPTNLKGKPNTHEKYWTQGVKTPKILTIRQITLDNNLLGFYTLKKPERWSYFHWTIINCGLCRQNNSNTSHQM